MQKTFLATLLALVVTGANTLMADVETAKVVVEQGYTGYLLSTPQISDPARPLAHAAAAFEEMEIHAAVVSMADPLETHLARMFDMQLSSIIRAFHARDYVLDGFAFTWDPKRGGGPNQGKLLPEEGTRVFRKDQRDMPGVLLFRKDSWRAGISDNTPGVQYVILFLVGESPTFGLQPKAFKRAATCAAALNGAGSLDRISARFSSENPLNTDCSVLLEGLIDKNARPELRVIGPTFSGSMQSLALALGDLHGKAQATKLTVKVISPSATVISNQRVDEWAKKLADRTGNELSVEYRSLAASLEQQLTALCGIDAINRDRQNFVILTEESTFGRGVYDILKAWSSTKKDFEPTEPGLECPPSDPDPVVDGKCKCSEQIRVAQFPQNISAIRAEHSRLDQQSNEYLKMLVKPGSQLLELDLTTVDQAADRPPPYDPRLSARSDELMLYGTFDALKMWVNPVAVAIVATDVRDRLFLLNEVRKNLPMALPVLLEMDFLTTHPDYRKISRGSVVIPSSDTTVRLDVFSGLKLSRDSGHPPKETSYYSFPSDYSANIFRAALEFLDNVESGPGNDAGNVSDAENPHEPVALVTTLAGFQKQDGSGSKVLAADSRLTMERPVYLLFLASGFIFMLFTRWLLLHGQQNTVMMFPLSKLNRNRVIPENGESSVGTAETTPTEWTQWAPWLLMAVSLILFLIAAVQFWSILHSETRNLEWNLPHGRDQWALICLFLIYAVVAVIGFWRVYLWRIRFNSYMGSGGARCLHLYDDQTGKREGFSKIELVAWLVISGSLLLSVLLGLIYTPTSVDPLWTPIIVSFLTLPVGAWFLFEFWRQWRNWTHLAMVLGQTMDPVSKKLTGKDSSSDLGWPSPLALGERPQSPFNLRFRRRDLDALSHSAGNTEWSKNTCDLLDGKEWPFGDGKSPAFKRWQARLAAEMRFAAVAVRTCIWCAILAPTSVLMGMGVYPAPWERMQTVISVALIISSFMLAIYAALGLERHPLLSRMFTQHGDRLSLGGAFNAVWPKLIAAVIILVPVLFPDAMSWLYTLLRSINSLT